MSMASRSPHSVAVTWALVAALVLLGMATPPSAVKAAPAPSDPGRGRPAARVVVQTGGIQQIGAAALAAAGLDPAAATALQLWRNGAPLPLEQLGAGSTLELRFFAPAPGDRWNAADTYWLTLEPAPGLRMASRSVTPAASPASPVARERGRWREPAAYDTRRTGPFGDHWFVADLRTGPGQAAAVLTATLEPDLPVAAGPMLVTVRGTAATAGVHLLDVTVGGETKRLSWSGAGDFAESLTFAGGAASVRLALVPGAEADQVLVAALDWERQASLSFAGRGAAFVGLEGRRRYELAGAPAGAALYDVSDANAPSVLTGVAGAFEDEGARSYLLAGPGTLTQPQVRSYGGLALPEPGQAIYIAPASLHAALTPLANHRRAAGHSVAVVDVQAIYDAWSGGQVAPEAIRSFLRHAAATWQPRPLAVTMVGDGTLDPQNYGGLGNPNLVPPYLAPVDPWLGETACEPCYGQLDGDSPLDDDEQDLAVGRLPVKSADELATVVAKIVGYETARGGLGWRSRAILVADNSREADGSPDQAGDFARFNDAVAGQLPAGMLAQKIYYDPWGRDESGAPLVQPWLAADSAKARSQVRSALGSGAGLVVYAGHASHWEWARTGPPLPPGEQYLLGLYDPDQLANGDRLPIVLSMTCLTSGFHQTAFNATTLDERLLLRSGGGAVAVWGPTGLGVAHGHDALMRGFLAGLRAAPGTATLGELTLAGFAALREDGRNGLAGDLSALRTYALLGDPLTPARVAGAAQRLALPMLGR